MPALEESLTRPRHWLWLSYLVVLAVCISWTAFAQTAQTLPLPAPGTPAAPPAAPAGVPPEDAAKARAAALAAKANIDVTGAWARATPNNATSADVYLQIVSAKDPDKLTGIDASMSKDVQVRDDSAPAALPIDVPPGGTVNLAPGMRHISLVGLKAPLKDGDSFLVTFHFDKAGTQSTVVKVVAANASGTPQASLTRRGDTTAGVTQR